MPKGKKTAPSLMDDGPTAAPSSAIPYKVAIIADLHANRPYKSYHGSRQVHTRLGNGSADGLLALPDAVDAIVYGGDIFDDVLKEPELDLQFEEKQKNFTHALRYSPQAMLETLIKKNPHTMHYFVVGNHDGNYADPGHPEASKVMAMLHDLSARYPNFIVCDQFVHGNLTVMHGHQFIKSIRLGRDQKGYVIGHQDAAVSATSQGDDPFKYQDAEEEKPEKTTDKQNDNNEEWPEWVTEHSVGPAPAANRYHVMSADERAHAIAEAEKLEAVMKEKQPDITAEWFMNDAPTDRYREASFTDHPSNAANLHLSEGPPLTLDDDFQPTRVFANSHDFQFTHEDPPPASVEVADSQELARAMCKGVPQISNFIDEIRLAKPDGAKADAYVFFGHTHNWFDETFEHDNDPDMTIHVSNLGCFLPSRTDNFKLVTFDGNAVTKVEELRLSKIAKDAMANAR